MTEENNKLDTLKNDIINNEQVQPENLNQEKEDSNNNDDDDYVALPIKSLEDAVNRLHNEANFAAKNFDAKSVSFAKNLNDLINQFDNKLVTYDQLIEHHNSATDYSRKELAALTLIPEKLQDRIEQIAPRFAIEVEKIHQARLEIIIQNIMNLQTKLDMKALANQQLIEATTAQCIEEIRESGVQLTALCSQNEAVLQTAEKFKQLIENTSYNDSVAATTEKFDQLRRDMQDFDQKRRKSYFIGLSISLVLMAIVAGASTYLTLKYYPTHVKFSKEIGQITVSGSDVSVWGTQHLHIKDKPKFK